VNTLKIAALVLSLATAGSALAEGPYLRQLPRTDSFRKVADAIGTRLRDEVISTGTFDIGAMQLVARPARLTDATLARLNLDLADRVAKMHDDKLPKDLAAGTTVKPFSGTLVKATGRHLAAVYAYAPQSGQEERLAKTVWVLLGKADVKEGNAKVVTSRARFYDSSTGTKKYFTQTLFLNTETGRGLVLYMVSGTM
jgi:hypothetical protein